MSTVLSVEPLYLAIAAGLLLLLLAAVRLLRALQRRRHQQEEQDQHQREYPYLRRGTLISAGELRFFRVLEQAVQQRWCIHMQVRLADLLQVQGDLEPRWRMTAQNRINSKQVDFVLCEPGSLAIVCAIELDDGRPRKPAQLAREAFIDEACRVAGLPLLRVELQGRLDAARLRQRIEETLRNCQPRRMTLEEAGSAAR